MGRINEYEQRVLAAFSRHYGITFHQPALLKLALTHRSYLSVSGRGPRESNERLEFLGDSVLGLVTSETLYRDNPHEHEGQLTKTKSLLVSKAILSRRSLAMGLGRFVLMSQSEIESGGRQRMSILADAFEAVVGAIYLDQGFAAAHAFITRWLLRDSHEIVADKRHTNYKSHLQEFVQNTYRTHPVYRIRSEMGPDHSKQFNVEVMVGRRVLGTGRGLNKKEAEQAAARDALERVERPKRERRVPAEPEATTASAEASERRRGRRGGRARSLRAEAPVATPMPSAPVAAPRPEPRAQEPVVPLPVREAEVEPEPPARYEDEMEEIGRPEGPLGRHVDPYAVAPSDTGSDRDAIEVWTPEDVRSRAPERRPSDEADHEAETLASEPYEPSESSDSYEPSEPPETSGAPEVDWSPRPPEESRVEDPGPRYGRRGRSRRR